MLIDTHVHLNADEFDGKEAAIIERAQAAGVEKLIVIGFDHKTNEKAITLAEQYDFIYATVGFHPTIAKEINDNDFVILDELLAHDKVVGIGECGLDFYWDNNHIDDQVEVFKEQIKRSIKLNKPLIIHMRDASEATYNVLSEYDHIKGVMHCYSGSAEMADKFLDLGLHISLGGPVTFKNAKTPKEVAKMVPLNRLLVETDSPYLSPHPYRGKRNEPARVKLVAEQIADLRDMSFKDIAQTTTQNAMTLFNLKE
ncbi:MAG: TatD family hydrolase [Candidatus Izemoplasma sp.]|nr:TatD family hydrolase [Candidatus Izemoplasma sp.]